MFSLVIHKLQAPSKLTYGEHINPLSAFIEQFYPLEFVSHKLWELQVGYKLLIFLFWIKIYA